MCNHTNKPIFIVIITLIIAIAHANADHCNSITNLRSLDPDRTTVLISGYSLRRVPILRSIAVSYAAHPLVAQVLILWFNPIVPLPEELTSLSESDPSVTLHVSPSPSLNLRFLPRREIRTRSVVISDDDVEISGESLSFAFNIWRSNDRSIVGFFARSHELDLDSKQWIYTRSNYRHSIVLTKLMLIRSEYLTAYSCSDDVTAAREVVERERNCEDILMNFVVAMESGGARPVVVEAKERVRDWGDPRNDEESGGEDDDVAKTGLSSRGDHWKRRGECIGQFHRILGRMPLRYGYGKVVEGDAEPGLCRKAGRIVPCDAD